MSSEPNGACYRARWVFSAGIPLVEDGTVAVGGECLQHVGRTPPAGRVEDLGDVLLAPGLINAHTHLEFSSLPQPLGPAQPFAEWIRQVVGYRRSLEGNDVRAAVESGLAESLACGVTSLGEIATPGWPRECFTNRPDCRVFRECLGLPADRVEPNLAAAREHLAAGKQATWQPGLCPHAPYTVHPQLFAQLVELAQAAKVPLAFHLAETREEAELLSTGSGPLRALLEEFGAWEEAIPAGTRPLDYLRQMARLPRAVVIHGNYLSEAEIEFVARHRDRFVVVYCPRTHAYFGHNPYPLRELLAAGIPVALGTDSRASNPDLDLWAELQTVAAEFPDIPAGTLLQMATQGGAQALDSPEAGTLAEGKLANLVAIKFPAGHHPVQDGLAAGRIVGVMHRGHWVRTASP